MMLDVEPCTRIQQPTMEEALKELGLNDKNSNHVEIYGVDLQGTAASQQLFDQQSKLKPSKKKDRQWLPRPLVEQQGVIASQDPSIVKLVSMSELATKVNHEFIDRILFVKTIRNPFYRHNALWTLAQDAENSAVSVVLSLWNYLPIHGNDEPIHSKTVELEVPNNSYLTIRNPLMVPNTLWGSNSNMVMIRCDNPDTITIYDTEEEWLQRKGMAMGESSSLTVDSSLSATQLKDKGNQAFGKKAFATSVRWYQKALEAATADANNQNNKDVAISCLGNMAETSLQMGKYHQAQVYARQILEQYDNRHAKAQFRLARALLMDNQPTEAKDILLQLRKQDPKNASFQNLLGDCLQAIMEQTMGKYNIRKMLGEASVSPELSSSFHADFTSPKVDLGVSVTRPWDGGTYRGVLAKQDIPEGTLLSACRAFAFCHQRGGSSQADKKRHMYEVSHVHQCVLALRNQPHLASKFYQLEAAGVIDTSTNTINEGQPIDLAKIRSILESNRFRVDLNSPASPFELQPASENDDDEYSGVGLWLSTSLFNHSCTPNCTWAQIGNHMFVHAAKDISARDELCISYVHAALSYQDRKEKFDNWNGGKGFECACEWCGLMRQNEPLRFMNEQVIQAQKRLMSGEAISSIDQLLSPARRQEIKDAHANLPERFQHTVYNVHMMEAMQLASESNRHGVLESVAAAASLGYAMRGGCRQETRVQDLCCLVAANMACNKDEEARKALEEIIQHQVLLPSFATFQNFIMMSSMTFWDAYQAEQFMKRWATLNKQVWEKRSKQLK